MFYPENPTDNTVPLFLLIPTSKKEKISKNSLNIRKIPPF
jgi:hypothetical protein